MDTKAIKEKLTIDDIERLLEELNAEPEFKDDNLIAKTICHDGDKHKLFYYDNSKMFVCFTGGCGNMDIFELVEKVKDVSFIEALNFVKGFFGLKGKKYTINNNKVVNPYKQFLKKIKHVDLSPAEKIDDRVLGCFKPLSPIQWVEEGITPDAMDKFDIRYNVLDQQIIIPHHDETGDLVGVRCRNLLPEALENGQKYMPLKYRGVQYNSPTGKVLYGLDKNKQAINNHKSIILFEAEKSVLKLDSVLGQDNYSVGLNGSNLTAYQTYLIKQLEIDEVIVALDKEFDKALTREARIYAEKIESEFEKLLPFFKVSILWDKDGLMNKKESPIDDGFDTFNKLMSNRIYLER